MPRPTLPAAPARHSSPDASHADARLAFPPDLQPEPPPGSPVDRRAGEPPGYGSEDFPGCESFHLPTSELDDYEGRLEYWEARTETAWKVSEPTTIYHERPARRLSRLAERIESLRGSRIESFGSADLVRFDAAGNKEALLQADEALYLHPKRIRIPGPSINVGQDPLPDVVLEVDHTTDVRRRKLRIYQEWGFPEVWVLVPPESRRRPSGINIHVLHGERYHEALQSGAFPGWQAEEIYLALIEGPLSPRARPALERVARAMGAREGTGPENDPITRSITRRAAQRGKAEGQREGREEGRREGREEGRREAHGANVLAVLRARGIEVTSGFAADRDLFGALPGDALMAAAVACRDEADFRRRIRAAAGRPG